MMDRAAEGFGAGIVPPEGGGYRLAQESVLRMTASQ